MTQEVAALGMETAPFFGIKLFVKRDVVIAGYHYFVGMGMRCKPLHETVDLSCFPRVGHVPAMN